TCPGDRCSVCGTSAPSRRGTAGQCICPRDGWAGLEGCSEERTRSGPALCQGLFLVRHVNQPPCRVLGGPCQRRPFLRDHFVSSLPCTKRTSPDSEGAAMTLDDVLAQVLALLQRAKRVSSRALQRRFDLEDDDLEDGKDECIYAKKLAMDEDNRVL